MTTGHYDEDLDEVVIHDDDPEDYVVRDCSDCLGTGRTDLGTVECPSCDGTGIA